MSFVAELFRDAVWPLLSAFAVALAAGPVVKRLAIRFDFFDRPDGGLKPHSRPIPYLGGMAIYLGWLTGLAGALYLSGSGLPTEGPISWYGPRMLIWIATAGTIMMVTGLIDDRRHLPPILRLGIQAAVSGILILGGIGSRTAAALLEGWIDPTISAATAAALPALSVVIAAFIIAAASNATNLIDGMDGLCAGVLGISAIGFMALSATLAANGEMQESGARLIVVITAAVAGACAAFLFFNFNPASMFMGDSGSLLLGFSVATILILLAEQAGWRGLVSGTMALGFPIFDLTLAVARRWLNKKPLFVGDRSHFYDQVRDRGVSIKRTVVLCYLMQAGFSGLGIAAAVAPAWAVIAMAVGVPMIGAAGCRSLGLLRVER